MKGKLRAKVPGQGPALAKYDVDAEMM